jgi:hypothetical protein
MSRKFLTLFESHYKKYQQGGFLNGDFVEFTKNFKSLDCYKHLNPQIKQAIDDVIASKLDLRVTLVKPLYPSAQPGNAQQTGADFYVDIAPHYGGGRYGSTVVSVPSSLLVVKTTYPDQNPLSPEFTRKDKITIKPEEVDNDDSNVSRRTDKGNGKLSPTDLSLATKNTKLANAKEPSTARYLKGLK